jgi:hypothetical protein
MGIYCFFEQKEFEEGEEEEETEAAVVFVVVRIPMGSTPPLSGEEAMETSWGSS